MRMHKPPRQIFGFVALIAVVLVGYVGLVMFRGPEGQFFDSAGVQIHYTDEGSGVPVVLVHGFAANSNLNWRMPGIVDRLKDNGYRVVAMDTRAHGYSGKPHEAGAYGMTMVDDIARLMDHLHIEKAHLAGYSMGGFLSLAFAGKYPERLLSLTQGGSGWYPKNDYPELVHTVPASIKAGTGLEPIIRFMEPKDAMFSELRIPIVNFILCMTNDEEAMGLCFSELPNLEGTEEQLRASEVPSLSIMGTKDPLRKSAEYMVEYQAGNHATHWIEGADHMTTLGDPVYGADFTQTFIDFLAANTPKEMLAAAK